MKKKSLVKSSISDHIIDLVVVVAMLFSLVVTLYPFLNILAISLNDSLDAVRGGIHIWPRVFTLDNYRELLKYNNLPHAFLISILRTALGVLTGIVASSMFAYTLSRRDYVFRKPFSVLLVLTLYVSGGLVPDYMLIRKLGMINSFWVYILPVLLSGWNVIVLRSFMDGLPYSLQESAKIDGANDLIIFSRIVLPLSLPVVATVSLFIAVGQWNAWMDTYLYASGAQELSTLQYELVKILFSATASQSSQAMTFDSTSAARNMVSPQSIRMAITIVATVPILCVYPFVQKYFVTGMTLGAVKS